MSGIREISRGVREARQREEDVQVRGRYSGEARWLRISWPEPFTPSWMCLSCRSFVFYLKESNFEEDWAP